MTAAWFGGSLTTAPALIGVAYQMQLGNPSNATADTNNHDHYLIQRTVEALDYNDNRGQPNWASWNLTASDIGTNDRGSFTTDTALPANFYHVKTGDYTGSGYDRGHLCPSKDRTDTSTNNDLVFLMSNILPQSGVNNSGVWLQFENYCRDLVQSTNNYELLITCGGSGYPGTRINTNGPVLVPDYVWKIAVVVPPGADFATNRITATNRVIALKVPNNDSATNSWPSYVTSATQIEVDTGLTFFTGLPGDVAAALRAKVDGQTNPPPALFSFTPTTGSAGTTVTILGTNFSSATAVAVNGAPALFTVDSAVQITAVIPTNASSGALSITTPSGTAVSTNPFTVLVNGGTLYSGTLVAWDFNGVTNFGSSPFAPTTSTTNLVLTGLTRGSGVRTNASGAAGGWGGVGFTNLTDTSALASNQFVTFSVAATNGYKLSFTAISRFDYYRSLTGPTNGLLQYQLGTAAFSNIAYIYYSVVGSGASNAPIDLSTFPELQNIGAGTNVTFRLVNYGGTSSLGTWYLYDRLGTTAPDFALNGTVTQVVSPVITPPTLTITMQSGNIVLSWPTNAIGFTLQQSTNIQSTNWTTFAGSLSVIGTDRTASFTNIGGVSFFRLVSP